MKKRRVIWLMLFALSLTGCDAIGDLYHPGNDAEKGGGDGDEEKVYAIGDTGPGEGKIFYVSEEGFKNTLSGKTCHYLEVSPSALNEELLNKWSLDGAAISISGTQTGIGTGAANTAAILNAPFTSFAAQACKNYDGGGKDDWFLPSRDELKELYKNRVKSGYAIGDATTVWSSSQASASTAWVQMLMNGEQNAQDKTTERPVCAVRAF